MATDGRVIGVVTPQQDSFFDRFRTVSRKLYKNYTLRALLQAALTIWGVMTLTFFLIRLMPGNPIDIAVAVILERESISYEEAYARVAGSFNFDPDASLVDQYVDFIGDLLRLDLGTSLVSPGTRVVDQIIQFLPWTLFAVGTGLVISFTIGILLGMLTAYYRNSPFDHAVSLIGALLTGVPNYIIGLTIIIVFGIQLKWFNVGDLRGTYDTRLTPGLNAAFVLDVLKHAALPILIYVLSTLGGWVLSMKSSTTSVLSEDYVAVAQARGLPERRIITAYVGRNASLPLFTQMAISVGFVLGGSVVIEELLVYWGLGHYLFYSITTRDYTAMQGVFLILTTSVVLANLFADLVYSRLDPRVRIAGDT
jgi:peptide/nickel transport system permease protein